MTDWWRALEEELEHRGIDAPDPWPSADKSSEQLTLTSEQRAFLEQVTSTPGQGVDAEFDLDDQLDEQVDDQQG